MRISCEHIMIHVYNISIWVYCQYSDLVNNMGMLTGSNGERERYIYRYIKRDELPTHFAVGSLKIDYVPSIYGSSGRLF